MSTVSIALCFDDGYCTHAAGTLASIVNHATDGNQYDIYIVHDGINEHNQNQLKKTNNRPNIAIKFVPFDISTAMGEGGHLYVSRNVSASTYTRLFLHRILPGIDRLLYLDGDVIVTSDIAELFNVDLEGCPIGVCVDSAVRYRGVEALKRARLISELPELSGYHFAYDYFRDYLGLEDSEIASYFNAGVALFDNTKAVKYFEKLPDVMQKKYYTYDQDILNIIFKDDKKLLDDKYNTFVDFYPEFVHEHKKPPTVIHYAGPKPYERKAKPGDEHYWDAIKGTGYYEDAKARLDYSIRLNSRRKILRRLLKYLIGRKQYDLLKTDPGMFFRSKQSRFFRWIGNFYMKL